jgi:hypothetical protein
MTSILDRAVRGKAADMDHNQGVLQIKDRQSLSETVGKSVRREHAHE